MTLDDEQVSPVDKKGAELLKRLYLRDPNEGGMDLEATGVKGSGKTSLIFDVTDNIMNIFNPEELVFMRDRYESPVQFNRFKEWKIWVEKKLYLRFRDVVRNVYFKLPIEYFETYDDLYENVHPGIVNVVYLDNEFDWVRKHGLVDYLRRHSHRSGNIHLDQTLDSPVWKTFILTEYEDLVPANESKPIWNYCKEFANVLKESRKGMTSGLFDTQNAFDCDHRVRGKISMKAYLRGAKVDKLSLVKQKYVGRLEEVDGQRQAFISHKQEFGKIRFNAFKPKKLLFEVVKDN